jgi:hypothetical protein
MLSNEQYQENEVKRFLNQNTSYFDTVQEFSESIENGNPLQDLEWIENGSFGAGACLVLKKTVEGLTKRMNHNARIGGVLLHATYGKPFRYWHKLSPKARTMLNEAVETWLKQNHEFAI